MTPDSTGHAPLHACVFLHVYDVVFVISPEESQARPRSAMLCLLFSWWPAHAAAALYLPLRIALVLKARCMLGEHLHLSPASKINQSAENHIT